MVILGVCMAPVCLACTATLGVHRAPLSARKGMGPALSSSPWDMAPGQSPLFPCPLPKFCPPLRAQDPLWGSRCPDAAHLDINVCSHKFLAHKLHLLVSHRGLGRKGGLGMCLGALGCTGRQGKAMGSLGRVLPGESGVHDFVWCTQEAVGGPGEGGLPGQALGCRVLSGVALGCTGSRWSVVAIGGEGRRAWGQPNSRYLPQPSSLARA